MIETLEREMKLLDCFNSERYLGRSFYSQIIITTVKMMKMSIFNASFLQSSPKQSDNFHLSHGVVKKKVFET